MLDDLSRRDLGWIAAKVFGTVAGAEFFAQWLVAAPEIHHHDSTSAAPPEPGPWSNYRAKFFSADEYAALDAYTSILIPTDETPGAREAHVAPFLDFLVNSAAEYAPEMQAEWRTAMKWLETKRFSQLTQEEKVALVDASSAPERDKRAAHDGYATYKLIKTATIRAYYTSRAGLIENLEYKGLAYLTEFPGCTHADHHRA